MPLVLRLPFQETEAQCQCCTAVADSLLLSEYRWLSLVYFLIQLVNAGAPDVLCVTPGAVMETLAKSRADFHNINTQAKEPDTAAKDKLFKVHVELGPGSL